ncbi:hypothetical protein SK128_009141 [Halocaridina rubra]|uniref:Carbohydrate sulfotransferase n=1 Tax=Halocaridina rubra TaxID=373956 RepID=A0AAN8WPM7_HALRR
MSAKFLRRSFAVYIFLLILIAICIHMYEKKVSSVSDKEHITWQNETSKISQATRDSESPLVPDISHIAAFKPKEVHYKGSGLWAADIEDTSYPSINISVVQNILEERYHKVLENCLAVLSPLELEKPINSKEFLISEKYKLIWCNIFKSASSSWLYNFLVMAGVKEKDMKVSQTSPIEFARTHYKRPSSEKLLSYLFNPSVEYTSFIIVRDPFERLLSAYRDKIESQSQKYYKHLRCKIEKDYAPKVLNPKGRDCKPSFPAFVDYVIDEHSKGNTPNEHWAPYYTFCSPCQVHFDYILHFETLAADEAYLVNAVSGLSSVVTPHKLHASHTSYGELTMKYFQLLSLSQLEKLYSIYEKDFRIFDYDSQKYFQYIT